MVVAEVVAQAAQAVKILATEPLGATDYHSVFLVLLLGMQVAAQLEQVTIEPKAA
jgi:hypothetical protein